MAQQCAIRRPDQFLAAQQHAAFQGRSRRYLASQGTGMKRPQAVAGAFVETNLNSKDCVCLALGLAEFCSLESQLQYKLVNV